MMPIDLEFDPGSHVYRLGGAVVPSVTTIIRPLQDFGAVPAGVLAQKAALGTAVHLACELDDAGELDDGETDPVVMGYVNGWRRFLRDTEARVLMCEQRLAHAGLRYAGTLDRVLVGARGRHGLAMLVDLKTSVQMAPSFGVQLAGYQLLLESAHPELPPLSREGLQLRADGTYHLQPYRNPNDRPCFMGLLAVHHWKESSQ